MTLRLNGSTSGYVEIDAPATAGSNTLVLPTGNGSANQFLKNGSTAGSLGWSSMVETATGVGIGVTPSYLVDASAATGTTTIGDGTVLRLASSTTNGDCNIRLGSGTNATTRIGVNGADFYAYVNGAERMRIESGGAVRIPGVYNNTTASAVNVHVASDGTLLRSTSSAKYKTDIETIQDSYADALLQCRPVWYRSTCSKDNPAWGWWGFIAEEVAQVDPRLVFWKTEESVVQEDGSRVTVPLDQPEPEGVQYDRFVPHLLNLIKRQQQAIETLEAKVAALEATP